MSAAAPAIAAAAIIDFICNFMFMLLSTGKLMSQDMAMQLNLVLRVNSCPVHKCRCSQAEVGLLTQVGGSTDRAASGESILGFFQLNNVPRSKRPLMTQSGHSHPPQNLRLAPRLHCQFGFVGHDQIQS
jgi:hypothetical protein